MPRFLCPAALLLLSLLFALAGSARAADRTMLAFHVSPTGNDAWTGTAAAPRPANRGPFRTLKRARDAVRSLNLLGELPSGGVTVWVHGVQECSAPLELGKSDGGRADAPVVYRGDGKDARLVGGRAVRHFARVRDPAVLRRLDPAARAHVLVADLRAEGITDFGTLRRRGFGLPVVPSPMELFFQGRPMTLARWPNEGWLTIGSAPAGQNGGRFTYPGDRPRRWAAWEDIWVHGYWTYDWADTYERVASLDAAKREATTAPPHGVYGYTPGKRFYFLNVLEELDQPGEYYVDRAAGRLYFWPPGPVRPGNAVVSLLEAPLVRLSGASHLTVRDLTFEDARGNGVQISGGEDDRIAGCTFRNLGDLGIRVAGGARHTVLGCDVYDTGEGAVSVEGGDRKTLTPCGHRVENCYLTRFNRWSRTYRPGVNMNGVGIRVAHNLIHDAPHNAILLGGNDHVIELNEIHDVCRETGDAGAVYMGRNLTMRGNVIRNNYFHDLRAGGLQGQQGFTEVMAVYLDDCWCGTSVVGNLFVRAGRAVMVGGGRDNAVRNNIFVDCRPAIHVDARGKSWAKFWFDGRDPALMDSLKEVNYRHPPYSTRYPNLPGILEDDPAQPKGNDISRNVRIGGGWLDLLDGLTPHDAGVHDNLTEGDPGFIAPTRGDFRLKPDAGAKAVGFQPLPLARVGLHRDEYRRRLPQPSPGLRG